MPRVVKRSASHAGTSGRSRPDALLPQFVPPQLSQLVEKPPAGAQWVHEIKLDGYRMAARIDNGRVQLLTRTGRDWTDKYPSVVTALECVRAKTAYFDGELCGVDDSGLPSFAQTQAATDGGTRLVYHAFDLLHLDGRDVSGLTLIERKAWLAALVADKLGLQFNDHETGDGELILKHAGKLGFEGVVSKTIDAPYAPGNRGLWRVETREHKRDPSRLPRLLDAREEPPASGASNKGPKFRGADLLVSTAFNDSAGTVASNVDYREAHCEGRVFAARLGPCLSEIALKQSHIPHLVAAAAAGLLSELLGEGAEHLRRDHRAERFDIMGAPGGLDILKRLFERPVITRVQCKRRLR